MRINRLAGILSLAALAATLPVSCNGGNGNNSSNSNTGGGNEPELIDYAAQAKLNLEYEGKNFLDVGVGEVTVQMYIDGDTTHFTELDKRQVNARYANINTPESTADIQKWGKSASLFVQGKLESASTIVLTNPTLREEAPEHDDNQRWLSLIWYATVENPTLDDFRCLNLEIVQEGYSAITGMESNYPFYDIFHDAQKQAQDNRLHIFAPDTVVDPNFYVGEAENISIQEFNENAAKYNGKKVHMSGIVSAFMGVQSVWVESIGDDGTVWGVYLFTGYTGNAKPLFKVGNMVEFTGAVTEFNGDYQITDLQYNQYFPTEDDVVLISENNPVPSASQVAPSSQVLAGDFNVNTTVTLSDDLVVTNGWGGTDEFDPDTGVNYANNAITLWCTNPEGEDVQVYMPHGAMLRGDDGMLIHSWTYFQGKTLSNLHGVVDSYNGRYSLQLLSTNDVTISATETVA